MTIIGLQTTLPQNCYRHRRVFTRVVGLVKAKQRVLRRREPYRIPAYKATVSALTPAPRVRTTLFAAEDSGYAGGELDQRHRLSPAKKGHRKDANQAESNPSTPPHWRIQQVWMPLALTAIAENIAIGTALTPAHRMSSAASIYPYGVAGRNLSAQRSGLSKLDEILGDDHIRCARRDRGFCYARAPSCDARSRRSGAGGLVGHTSRSRGKGSFLGTRRRGQRDAACEKRRPRVTRFLDVRLAPVGGNLSDSRGEPRFKYRELRGFRPNPAAGGYQRQVSGPHRDARV